MNWLRFALAEARRRPLRSGIATAGVALAVAGLFSLVAFHKGYRDGIKSELDRLGGHVLLVPKGCPYDAASIALHGANWPCYLKASYLHEVSSVPGVATVAPAFMAAMTGTNNSQVVYVGIDECMLALKCGWEITGTFPRNTGEVLPGAEAARARGWKVGERVKLPELGGKTATVTGILRPTDATDDAFIYMRLEDAQTWFGHPGELTHMLVRLKDAQLLDSTVASLRGCDAGMDMNIVPVAHLFRTIQSLMNSTGILLGAVALIGLLIAVAGVSNSLLMSVSERSREIGIMRALGASRSDVFRLICMETLQVCLAGSVLGIFVAFVASRGVEAWLRARLPFSPTDTLVNWDWRTAFACVAGAMALGCLAALLPASRAAELAPAAAMREIGNA
jgi:putative ABC transport system permease protein